MLVSTGELPDWVFKAHYECNDDGKWAYHPGYEARQCQTCHKVFICARTSPFKLCNLTECKEVK